MSKISKWIALSQVMITLVVTCKSSNEMVLYEPSPLPSHNQIKEQKEDMSLLTNSPVNTENERMATLAHLEYVTIEAAPADLDLGPAFSPQANVTEGCAEIMSSNLQTTEILQAQEKESSDIDCEATLPLPTSAGGSLQEATSSRCQCGLYYS